MYTCILHILTPPHDPWPSVSKRSYNSHKLWKPGKYELCRATLNENLCLIPSLLWSIKLVMQSLCTSRNFASLSYQLKSKYIFLQGSKKHFNSLLLQLTIYFIEKSVLLDHLLIRESIIIWMHLNYNSTFTVVRKSIWNFENFIVMLHEIAPYFNFVYWTAIQLLFHHWWNFSFQLWNEQKNSP